MEAFLGIDIGTTATKAALFDPSGKGIGFATVTYDVNNPAPYHYEQDPRGWWVAVKEAISRLQEKTDFDSIEILSIGVCGQTPTLVFIDKNGEVLRPAILWKDSRAQKEALFLKETVGEKWVEELVGTRLPLEASWTTAKLLWVKENERDTLRKTYKILQPKDFINYKLSNVFASDYWCSRGLVNVNTMKPPDEYYRILGIRTDIAPEAFPPSTVVGAVSREAAREVRIREGIPIVAGWPDSFCGILGVGAFAESGQAFDIAGTSEIVGVSVQSLAEIPPGLLAFSAEGFQSIIFGPTQSGGGTLDWFLDRFIKDQGLSLNEKYDWIDKVASTSSPNANSIIFLPFIEGERAPIWNPKAKGIFFGVTKDHHLNDFTHSMLSGVAFNVLSIFELLEGAYGKEIEEFSVSGGSSGMTGWNKIRCDVMGKKIKILENTESSVLGAAMLGALGVHYFHTVADMTTNMIRVKERIEPDKANHVIYRELYQKFQKIYSLLEEEF